MTVIEGFDVGAWVRSFRSRLSTFPVSPGEFLSVGDMELLWTVREHEGAIWIEHQNRGSRGWAPGRFSDAGSAIRHLLLTLSDAERRSRGLSALDTIADSRVLITEADGALRLTWGAASGSGADGRWAVLPAGGTRDPRHTRLLTRAIPARLADVAEALLDPLGEPVFRGFPPRTAERDLSDHGEQLFLRLGVQGPFAYRVLPEGAGVAVVRPVRGGGSIYVAPDRTALFVVSAVPPHRALEEFLAGHRTPEEQLRGSGDPL